jgi:hypothetical protein
MSSKAERSIAKLNGGFERDSLIHLKICMSASEFALKFLSHVLEKCQASRSIVLAGKTGNNHRSKKTIARG